MDGRVSFGGQGQNDGRRFVRRRGQVDSGLPRHAEGIFFGRVVLERLHSNFDGDVCVLFQPAPAPAINPSTFDIQPEDYVAPRFLRKLKNKVNCQGRRHFFEISGSGSPRIALEPYRLDQHSLSKYASY